MESFKIVLPSNASYEHFPNNTSSHYQTYLHNPIQLEGKWEVAAESVFYSANIENRYEEAVLNLTIENEEKILVNDFYPWKFKLSLNGTWPGFTGVRVPEAKTTFQFIDVLSSNILIEKINQPLFLFTRDYENRVTYRGKSPNFSIEITPELALALGFDRHHVTFSGTGPYKGNIIKDEPIKPKEHIFYFHSQLVQQERIISVKYPGEECHAKTLLQFWNERVMPYTNTVMEFSKHNKVILHHLEDVKALVFSSYLSERIDHNQPLIHRQTRWSQKVYRFKEGMLGEHWYVVLYSTEMQSVVKKHSQHTSFKYQPRLFATVERMISFLNENVISILKAKLEDKYNVEKHKFSLSSNDQRVSLNLGSWLQLSCSPNVTQMLGFDKHKFNGGNYVGTFAPRKASNRVQRVLLMTDVIESISYGNQRLQILQDFVHYIKGAEIIEKRFQPLSFVPVMRNYIDTITIQLVNEEQQQITAKDVKTVVVLHFQRVKQ